MRARGLGPSCDLVQTDSATVTKVNSKMIPLIPDHFGQEFAVNTTLGQQGVFSQHTARYLNKSV